MRVILYISIIYINVPEFLFRQLEEGRREFDIVQSKRKLLMEEAHCKTEFKSPCMQEVFVTKKKDNRETMRGRKAAVISAGISTPTTD